MDKCIIIHCLTNSITICTIETPRKTSNTILRTFSCLYGNISSIETGFVDGPGVRAVVYFQGCPLRCLYCHNPETWTGVGSKEISPEDVFAKFKKYETYYGENGGVTFSGGEPLLQSQFLLETIKLFKENGVHITIDTCGVADGYDEVLDRVDLLILDVKAVEADEYKFITGREIDDFNKFLKDCINKNKKLWLRQVIVPGINDDEKHVLMLKEFASKIPNVERVELLPYHSMGKSKYEKLGIAYKLEDTPNMDKEELKKLQDLLK